VATDRRSPTKYLKVGTSVEAAPTRVNKTKSWGPIGN